MCLLRAAEVDVCGYKEIDRLDTGGGVLGIDTAGGGRAVVMEEGVLLLILRACAMFHDHDGVVKACCMLMRVGVQCSLSGEKPKVRPGLMLVYVVFHSPHSPFPKVLSVGGPTPPPAPRLDRVASSIVVGWQRRE